MLTTEHPFDNHGASSGTCQVYGGIAPDHPTVKLKDGTVIPLYNYYKTGNDEKNLEAKPSLGQKGINA